MKYQVTGKATWLYWRDISIKDLLIRLCNSNIFESKDKAIDAINNLKDKLSGDGSIDDYVIEEIA